MISCNGSSLLITSVFLFVIITLTVWSTSKSHRQNCCNSKSDFMNCKSDFGNSAIMNDDSTYQKICNK